jgi:HTH-type transcriptional regulator, sugar sensing transcriptional regulator
MEKQLVSLGFTAYESRIISVLCKESLPLKALSKQARVPFGKIYSVVKGLVSQGLVEQTSSWPKKLFISNPSQTIAKLIEHKQLEERESRENLIQFVSEIELSRNLKPGFFQIGTTNEENRSIQLQAFKDAKKEVLQILNVYHRPTSNRNNKSLWEKEILDAVKRGVFFKSIYPMHVKLPLLLEELHKKNPKQFAIRRIDTYFTRCDIIDKDKVLIKLVQEDPLHFGGIIYIRNERLNENLRKLFLTFWEG